MDREALQRQRTNDRSRWPGTRASGRREPLSSARSLAQATTFPWTPRSVDGQWAVWPFRLCAERRPPANPKSLPWRRGPGAAVPESSSPGSSGSSPPLPSSPLLRSLLALLEHIVCPSSGALVARRHRFSASSSQTHHPVDPVAVPPRARSLCDLRIALLIDCRPDSRRTPSPPGSRQRETKNAAGPSPADVLSSACDAPSPRGSTSPSPDESPPLRRAIVVSKRGVSRRSRRTSSKSSHPQRPIHLTCRRGTADGSLLHSCAWCREYMLLAGPRSHPESLLDLGARLCPPARQR